MINCSKCGVLKNNRNYRYGRSNMVIGEVCVSCRSEPKPVIEDNRVKANTTSRMEGLYDPPTWHTRKGSDAFTKIRSLGV